MSSHSHIFHDPTGRRKRTVLLGGITMLILVVACVLYAYQLFHATPILPKLIQEQTTDLHLKTEKQKQLTSKLLAQTQNQLNLEINENSASIFYQINSNQIQFIGQGDWLIPKEIDSTLALENSASQYDPEQVLVLDRRGFQPKMLAITFEGGPTKDYTPKVLEILAKHNVLASFFITGQLMQQEPELIKQIYLAGHDLGNNGFSRSDLNQVTLARFNLELNTTQRIAQNILGHSLTLFRPPYFTAGSPKDRNEVRQIKRAHNLNYNTIGVSLDIRDWESETLSATGEKITRSAQQMHNQILTALPDLSGNTILLHDGPKDREVTIELLDVLIPELKNRGYSLVTTSQLLGFTRNQTMPIVTEADLPLAGIGAWYLDLVFGFRGFLEIALIALAAFGVFRVVLFIVLSRRSKKLELAENIQLDYCPPLSVVIAAYNEEKVICQTIKSLLESTYQEFEIIVVDDGSKDNTAQVVTAAYGNHPKVKLISKPNGGKSSALNAGISLAQHEFIIGLDADTIYAPQTLSLMVRHFKDPRVAAVAGNVKVGNRHSFLLQCQSIEYITNQNLGRRAFAVLDAITVVPGAAGAWRKSALQEVGGYLSDTLGEDMELTWRIRKAGYKITFEPLALAYTEAPENVTGLFKQRFRWIYGQLQILWKNWDVFFNAKYAWFGWFGAPLLIIDLVFLFISPLADLQAIITVIALIKLLFQGSQSNPEVWANAAPLAWILKSLIVYLLFFASEIACTIYACRLDRESVKPIWVLFFKQFFYRQLMYFVTYRAIWRALTGWRSSWGVLKRTGNVPTPELK